jgi:hypothetical protein
MNPENVLDPRSELGPPEAVDPQVILKGGSETRFNDPSGWMKFPGYRAD